jgi:hypothetical protein
MATSHVEVEDSAWTGFYRLGGAAALIATVLFLSDVVVLIALGPLPTTASDWFTLLQNNRVIGILQLFFSDLIGMALLIPIVFALYAALRRVSRVNSALAMALAFIGIAVIFATNTNYSLIYLSNQYAAAITDIQRAQLVTAGESTLATGMWGTGPLVAALLVEGALVILSVIMLQDRTHVFGQGTAYLGILAHGLDVAHSLVFLVFIPFLNSDLALTIGTSLLAIGGTLQLIWYPLVGRGLLRLGRRERKVRPQPAQA